MPKHKWIFFRVWGFFQPWEAISSFFKSSQVYIKYSYTDTWNIHSLLHILHHWNKRTQDHLDVQKLKVFFSDKACLAEIETVCLEEKFSYKVQRKAEGTNKWKSPVPAAGHGATLRELSGTGPAVSHFSYQTGGVNKPMRVCGREENGNIPFDTSFMHCQLMSVCVLALKDSNTSHQRYF